MTARERELHNAGARARQTGKPKSPPALSWAERHWWLAGWNQEDMDRRAA